MTSIFAKQALLPDGWAQHVRVAVNNGMIFGVVKNTAPQTGDVRVDTLLPALANLHSHSFQRAMAGMAEKNAGGSDSFWTWREVMYSFLQHLTPEDIESIAAFAFMEMQEAGFAAVAEFHYLHHGVGGVPYANCAELSTRIMSAAHATGIGLTLLPVFYRYNGMGNKPLSDRQLRFRNDCDQYQKLLNSVAVSAQNTMPSDTRLGIAPHSLRAVSAEDLAEILHDVGDKPVHLHIAEQIAEVEEVVAATGQRPVTWLLAHAAVTHNWCLIHATHMTPDETEAVARSGAIAGLCPLTEANLGDGIFNGVQFLSAGGRYGVGSDSNVNISVTGELASLEYSQRLHLRRRNVLAPKNRSTGMHLYTQAAKGGAQALARDCGDIKTGALADLVAINSESPQLFHLTREQLLDGWIFAGSEKNVTDLWSAGRHVVAQGRHINRGPIEAHYRATLARLLPLL